MGNTIQYHIISHHFRFQRIRPAFASGPKFLLQSRRAPNLIRRIPRRPRPRSTRTRQLRLARRGARLPFVLVGTVVSDV